MASKCAKEETSHIFGESETTQKDLFKKMKHQEITAKQELQYNLSSAAKTITKFISWKILFYKNKLRRLP
jgi:hypothetical protein